MSQSSDLNFKLTLNLLSLYKTKFYVNVQNTRQKLEKTGRFDNRVKLT